MIAAATAEPLPRFGQYGEGAVVCLQQCAGYDGQANLLERVKRMREAEEAAKAPVIFRLGSRTPSAQKNQ